MQTKEPLPRATGATPIGIASEKNKGQQPSSYTAGIPSTHYPAPTLYGTSFRICHFSTATHTSIQRDCGTKKLESMGVSHKGRGNIPSQAELSRTIFVIPIHLVILVPCILKCKNFLLVHQVEHGSVACRMC